MAKHIFIGLGGSGVTTVANLKYKIYAHTKATLTKTRLEVLNSTHRFFFVDTDDKAINLANERLEKQFEDGRVRLIDDNERVNLGDINPTEAYAAAGKQDTETNRTIATSCSTATADRLQKQQLVDGAGMIRMSSRIAFLRKADLFFDGITNAYNSLKDPNNPNGNDIKFWIVSSSCGGTGSGIVNDVLYYVNMATQMQGAIGHPDVALILYMPKLYMNNFGSSDQYANNAFALYKEIRQIAGWSHSAGTSKYIHAFVDTLGHKINSDLQPYRPFRFCIPIDFEDEAHRSFSNDKEMYSTTAELLDYVHEGAGAAAFRSVLINAEAECQSRNLRYTLIPMGYAALRKPEEMYDKYMSLRFRYELIKYGILGEGINIEECLLEVSALFKSIIEKVGFADRQQRLTNFIGEHLDQSIIENNKGKVVVDPKGVIAQGLETDVLSEFQKEIDAKLGSREIRIQKAVEEIGDYIWRWVESTTRAHGLLYVHKILMELDASMERLYSAYRSPAIGNEYSKVLSKIPGLPLKTSRESLLSLIGQIDLFELANKAFEVTLGELLIRNTEDVTNYLDGIRNWVSQKSTLSLYDEIFDIIWALSGGDNGVLDIIKNHVASLIDSASGVQAEQSYRKLASTFYELSTDVRTRYIPDITKFSDGERWNSNHLFDSLYSSQIRTERYDDETGWPIPQHSDIEHIYGEAVRKHDELHLDEEGYYDVHGSCFFINTRKKSSVVIEELTNLFTSVFNDMLKANPDVQSKWINKSLSDFINTDLTVADLQTIRDEGNAAVMMCYNKQRGYNPIACTIKVAPTSAIGKLVFSSVPGSREQDVQSTNPSEIYRLISRIGLPFESYEPYLDQQVQYEKSTQKDLFHFHRNFAEDPIRIPKIVNPEKITFVRYLLLNKMKMHYNGILVQGTGSYNKDNYADSPVMENEKEVRFATENAFSLNEMGDHIELATANYYGVPVENNDQRYTVLLDKFISSHNTMNYTNFIKRFIDEVNRLKSGLFVQNYSNARKVLFEELDGLCVQAKEKNNGTEQGILTELLTILDNQLKTVEQFVG